MGGGGSGLTMSSESIRQVLLHTSEKLVAASWLRDSKTIILRLTRSLSMSRKNGLVWMTFGAEET